MIKIKLSSIYVHLIVLVAILHLMCVSCQNNTTNLAGDISKEVTSDEPLVSSGLRGHNQVSYKQNEMPHKRRAKRDSSYDPCLIAHNKYRALHDAPPMSNDPEIQRWANRRAREIVQRFGHVGNSPYGENLAMHSRPNVPCEQLVKMWYDEIENYDFSNPGFSMGTGHFTQLVWKNSVRLGCGYYTSEMGTYLSCSYGPHGNVLGDFEDNVSPRYEW